MIEYLYANGCSWTHGNGIIEDPIFDGKSRDVSQNFGGYEPLKFAWPHRLGELLNCNVNNDGWGAGSNSRMIRRTIEFLNYYPESEIDKLLIVIGWSTLERDEIYVGQEIDRWVNYNAAQQFSTQFNELFVLTDKQRRHVKLVDVVQKQYVTWVHDNRGDIEKYFLQLYLFKNYLENIGVKYLMFNALPWTWVPEEELNVHIPKFEKFISSNFIGPGTNETMMSFCNDNSLPLSTCIHPMVEGHKQWAEKLFNQLKTVYPEIIND